MCFSDTVSDSNSDGEELLAFVAQDNAGDNKPAEGPENEEDDDDLFQDLEAEYITLSDKFTELSHENLQLLKDRAMLKAQVNIPWSWSNPASSNLLNLGQRNQIKKFCLFEKQCLTKKEIRNNLRSSLSN